MRIQQRASFMSCALRCSENVTSTYAQDSFETYDRASAYHKLVVHCVVVQVHASVRCDRPYSLSMSSTSIRL